MDGYKPSLAELVEAARESAERVPKEVRDTMPLPQLISELGGDPSSDEALIATVAVSTLLMGTDGFINPIAHHTLMAGMAVATACLANLQESRIAGMREVQDIIGKAERGELTVDE